MKKKPIKGLFQQFSSDCFNAVVYGTVLGAVSFYACSLFMSAEDYKRYGSPAVFMFLVNIIAVTICLIIILFWVKMPVRRYDSEIIGTNFFGITKKCRIFNRSVKIMFQNRYNAALSGFKSLEDGYSEKLSEDEKQLVYFYIARCYDEMTFYPNAVIYYEKASKPSFLHDVAELLYARCLGSNGDTRQALNVYDRILENPANIYSQYVRTDIGRMYLRQNDAQQALDWYNDAINRRENYATALGEAAIAYTMLHQFDKGEEMYRAAVINHINGYEGFTAYYKKVQAAALMEAHTKECTKAAPENTERGEQSV